MLVTAAACASTNAALGNVLLEAGFTVRTVSYGPVLGRDNKVIRFGPPVKGIGHLWLEVDVRDEEGKMQTYILDAAPDDANKIVVETLFAAQELARNDVESVEARYYVNPGRKVGKEY